jgi:hypothetical protein
VRAQVAANPATPAELLGRLARDRNPLVLLALVRNADTPDAALDEMSRRLHGFRAHLTPLSGRGATQASGRVRQALDQRRSRPAGR